MGDANKAATFGYVAREVEKRDIALICARESFEQPQLVPELKKAFGGPLVANELFTTRSMLPVRAATRRMRSWPRFLTGRITSLRRKSSLGQSIFVDRAVFHNHNKVFAGIFDELDIFQGIAIDHQQICECALFHDAKLAGIGVDKPGEGH
jgi:hypothetical protein